MSYSNYLKDKVALIAGSGEELGQWLCLKLAEYKAVIICIDIDLRLAEIQQA